MGKFNKMIKTIYLDMDGVISNFDKGYFSIYGVNCREDNVEKHWYDFVENKGFFNLEPYEDMDELISFLTSLNVEIVILSCVSERSDYGNVTDQKIQWLKKYGLGQVSKVFTRTKLQKSEYAHSESLLIDDSVACITPFKQKNGYAILHTSAKQTIMELECLKNKGIICAL